MGLTNRGIQLAPLVYYNDYDGIGLFLDVQQGAWIDLSEQETALFRMVLSPPLTEDVENHFNFEEKNITLLLERLSAQHLIETHIAPSPQACLSAPSSQRKQRISFPQRNVLKEQLMGAGHIIVVLNELRKKRGFYKAFQYIHYLEQERNITIHISQKEAFLHANNEYWVYRLVTGLFEHRLAFLLGHLPGGEGLCLVKAFALCTYLLSRSIPAQIVIARSKYGSRSEFKRHAWVEIQGKPFNEHANIHDGFQTVCMFPLSIDNN